MDTFLNTDNSKSQVKRLLQLFWATEIAFVVVIIQRVYLHHWHQALAVAISALLLTSVYFMAHRGKAKLGGNILLLILTFMLLGFVWKYHGLRDEVLLVFPAIIMFSLLLGSKIFALYVYLFVCLNVFIIGFMNEYGYIHHGHLDSDISSAILIIIILSLISYAVLLFAKDINRTNNALLKSKEELELRVLKRTEELQESLNNLTNTQDQLIEAEKMASLGRLVAGVAHEINTPLGIAITASSHLENATDKFSQEFDKENISKNSVQSFIAVNKKSTELVLSNLQRAADLVQSFKEVAIDQSENSNRKFNIKSYLNEILANLTPKLKETKHKVELFCDDNLEVYTNAGAIAQIITHLFMNSFQHGFEGVNQGLISIIVNQNKENTTILFLDSGRGIIPENIDKIFEPFYTTTRRSGAIGLGLHVTYNLMTQSLKGSISCSSTLNKGTQFELIFPSKLAD
ncbi:MAG: HAMP domain-containing histidine kinase [Colwellia sp.]|nr:HAMP domain-containing histidine kinase [Colwellia sp.]